MNRMNRETYLRINQHAREIAVIWETERQETTRISVQSLIDEYAAAKGVNKEELTSAVWEIVGMDDWYRVKAKKKINLGDM